MSGHETGTTTTTTTTTARGNRHDAAGNYDVALMYEIMAQAMKKGSQQRLLAELPLEVRKRIRALRKLQLQTTNLEAEFHRLVYDLERKHQDSYATLYAKRNGIVNGTYEPNDEECDFPDPVLTDAQLLDAVTPQPTATSAAANAAQQSPAADGAAPPSGVPHFWLNIFKYVPMFQMMVRPTDESALKHLADIRVRIRPLPVMSFVLEFCFTPNDYFDDAVLTKEYLMRCELDAELPFAFDGPEIYKCHGCEIRWKTGMNLTERIVQHKSGPECGPPKTLKTDTFFDFFDPPTLPEDTNHKDYDTINTRLEHDFEIGHYLKERIVPRAVLYYTGENDDDFDSDDDEGSSSDSMGYEDFEVSEESVAEQPANASAVAAAASTLHGDADAAE